MKNRTYDVLKYIVQIVLPALATLYFTLASIWGLPWAEQVVGTMAAIATFLGVILKISSNTYDDTQGDMIVTDAEDGRTIFSLSLNDDPENLRYKDRVAFRVNNE